MAVYGVVLSVLKMFGFFGGVNWHATPATTSPGQLWYVRIATVVFSVQVLIDVLRGEPTLWTLIELGIVVYCIYWLYKK